MNRIKKFILIALMMHSIVYAVVPGLYLGIHQNYGSALKVKDHVNNGYPITDVYSGLSGVGPLNLNVYTILDAIFQVGAVHYQHSEEWGVTLTPLSKFTLLNIHGIDNAAMTSLIAKKRLFQLGYSKWYFPLGFWHAFVMLNEPNNTESSFVKGYGPVFGGLGVQLNLNRLLIDMSYQRFWSVHAMEHMNTFVLSISCKLFSVQQKSETSYEELYIRRVKSTTDQKRERVLKHLRS